MKAARAEARLTQQELADRANVSRRAVIDAETDTHVPHGEALARIAKALDVSIDSLFDDEVPA